MDLKDSMNQTVEKFLLTVLALILPPVAVFVKAGHHWQLYVNVFFCMAFYFPAVIHAVWFVRRTPRTPMLCPDEVEYVKPQDPAEMETVIMNRVEPRLD
jgi:uncharacterized membrane protein YqaE (UPF0057 family)